MTHRFVDPSSKEVEAILKCYLKPRRLEESSACTWPAVLEQTNAGVVTAIRNILNRALDKLEASVHEKELLRERYIHARPVEELAETTFITDISTLHRRRNRYIEELCVIIGEVNRVAQCRIRARPYANQGPIVGIHELAANLAAHIQDPHAAPVVVIEGMGGLGKTTLARLVAHRIAYDDTFAGILWASAQQAEFDTWGGRQYRRRSLSIRTEDLMGQLAAELGLQHTTNADDLRADIIARCKQAPYLIVFDNLESLEDLGALAPLIESLAVPSRILLTTREHTINAIPPTIKRRYHALEELAREPSIQLLRMAATHVGASTMHEASDGDLALIYGLTGGNPLALWLVAGQSDSMPWRMFLQEFVTYGPKGKVDELYSYCYQRSWELLSDDAQRVLLAMHRFESGTHYDMLRDVADMDLTSFQHAVEELHNRMLLLFDGSETVYIHHLTYTFLQRGVLERS